MHSIYKRPIIHDIDNKYIPDDDLEFLKEFEETLKNTNFDLRIFYKNCKSLEIITTNDLDDSFLFSTDGEYNLLHNQIFYNPKSYKTTIFHELFHMASTVVGHKAIHSGFLQSEPNNKLIFGIGLTEAYTSILDLRYFGGREKEEYYSGIYYISRPLVELLEEILGRDNMEYWYSRADLQSLIESLSTYFGFEPAINFINAIDKVSYYNECDKLFNPFASVIYYRFAVTFLGRCLMKKYIHEYSLTNNLVEYNKNIARVREIMDKRIIYPIPFKIIRSRKYTDKEFEHDIDIIKNKVLKKYA